MRIVIAGGTGQLGRVLTRALRGRGDEVVVLSRGGAGEAGVPVVLWDGGAPGAQALGAWAAVIDGADAVINLAGRSVSCRYTEANLAEMMRSRTSSTQVIGAAIAAAARPPHVWLQMSTATIYAHRFDADNDEASGVLGGSEPDAPGYWRRSIDIATAWERALSEASTPKTRKVALRTAMVMSPQRGGVFDVLLRLVRFGLGGAVAGGRQYVSWIHDVDFVRAVELLLARDDIAGAVNLAAPTPVPQRDFMATLRAAWGAPFGLPATSWMAELGALVLRTDTELLFKSRRVVPGRLAAAGFAFAHPVWAGAAHDLVARWQQRARGVVDAA